MISTALNSTPCGKAFTTPTKTPSILFSTVFALPFSQSDLLVKLLNSNTYVILRRTNNTTTTTVLNYLLIEE